MKSAKFECGDKYEAEKLASLIGIQKDKSVYLAGVAALIKNEIVLKLKDNSHHAVILKDEKNAKELKSLLLDIVGGRKAIQETRCIGPVAEIFLS